MQDHTFFKCLSEPVRIRLLVLLYHFESLCVCELVDGLELPQSVVSRHLAYLRKNLLLKTSRSSQWVFYALNTEHHRYHILQVYLQQLIDEGDVESDIQSMNQVNRVCT